MNVGGNTNGWVTIVDDDEALRQGLGSVLQASGFETESFTSAEEYLNSSSRARTLCLVLDVRLPGMSGIELQRKLGEAGDVAPIVFITGHGDRSICDLVMRAGAVACLNKPIHGPVLLKEVSGALEKRLRA